MLARARSTEGFITGLFVTWLYIDAPKTYFGYIQELIFGLYEYFSISLHVKTLFAPFRKDGTPIGQLPVSLWTQTILLNLVSRTIGLILRVTIISLGILGIIVTGIGSALFLLAWLLLPLLLIGSTLYGGRLIILGSL